MNFIESLKDRARYSLGKWLGDPRMTSLEMADRLEAKIGFVPVGLDYFCPSRKVLGQLLENRIREDGEIGTLIDDLLIRAHLGEEPAVDPLHLRVAQYIYTRRIALLGRWLEGAPHDSILEIGDSDGVILGRLGRRGVGFNISPGAVRNIARHGILAVRGDLYALPFPPKAFDTVMLFETFEHLRNPAAALSVLAGLARKKVILSIPCVPRTKAFSSDHRPGLPKYRQHVVEFSDADFRRLVAGSAFKVARSETVPVFGRPRTFAQKRLYFIAGHRYVWGDILRAQSYYELLFKD